MADHGMCRSTKPRNDLTAEFVRSILDYDPETGILRWKISRPPRGKVGAIAGAKKPTRDGKSFYVSIGINGRMYLAHRLAYLIITGEWPTDQIDHKDLDPSNNSWIQIRPATNGQNQFNHGPKKNNKSGIKGVHKRRDCNSWAAFIQKDGKTIYLGCFRTSEEAAAAYQRAAAELHGEFARFD